MGKRQVLFVTYRDDNLEEGLSYATELAKAMYEDITLLLVRKKSNLLDKFGTLMTAVTFAEAGEHEKARQAMAEPGADSKQSARKLAALIDKCAKQGILMTVEDTDQDAVSGIRSYLKNRTGIDKVVLSPAITQDGNVTAKDLNRLVRTSSRPIITMTRQAAMA
jgi:hypothetical protein